MRRRHVCRLLEKLYLLLILCRPQNAPIVEQVRGVGHFKLEMKGLYGFVDAPAGPAAQRNEGAE